MLELIIAGRDNWSHAFLDRIEKAVEGKIVWHRDDGAGRMWFGIRYPHYVTKPEQKRILRTVQKITPNAHWAR